MGTTAEAPAGNVRPVARKRAQTRELRGDLVHLTGAKGVVKVRRAGSFAWETVGPEGLTVNAADTVTTSGKGRVTLTDKQGMRVMGGGSTGAAAPPKVKRSKVKIPRVSGMVLPSS